jgi:hypothetical protein
MWASCTFLFTTVLISNAEWDDRRLKQVTDIVYGVQQYLHSGCVSLLSSSATEGKRETLWNATVDITSISLDVVVG